MKQNKKIRFIFAFFLLILIIFGERTLVNSAHQPTAGYPPSQLEAQIDNLQASLDGVQQPETRQALEQKLAIQQFSLDTRLEAQSQPAPDLAGICANRISLPDAKAALETGILAVRPDFLGMQGYMIKNMYRGWWQGYLVEVSAGSRADNPLSGLVIISLEELGVRQIIADPQPAGALTITAVSDQRLTLQAADGSLRYFDIPAMQFAGSLEEVLPAADLPPAPTPLADPCNSQ